MTYLVQGEKPLSSGSTQALGKLMVDPPSPADMKNILQGMATELIKTKIVDRVEKVTDKLISRALGPFSILSDFIIASGKDYATGIKDNMLHLEGIKAFDQKNIPGFVYKQVEIDGVKVRIGVDASGQIGNPKAEPFVLVEVMDSSVHSNGQQPDDIPSSYKKLDIKNPALQIEIEAMKNKASADIEGYKQNIEANLPAEKAKHIADLQSYIVKIQNATPEELDGLKPPSNPLGVESRYQESIDAVVGDRTKEIAGAEFQPAGRSVKLAILGLIK